MLKFIFSYFISYFMQFQLIVSFVDKLMHELCCRACWNGF